jgi:MFS family permease
MGHKHELTLERRAHAALSVREQLVLSFLWFAFNIQSAALLPIVIPTQVLVFVPGAPGSAPQAIFLGWLSALGAIAALLLQPVTGAFSDHTPGPWGRRRPYILAGGAVMLAGTLALGLVRDALAFVAAFVVVNVGTNIATAAYQSLLPDRVPPEQRGAASGYMGLMTILGNVGSLAIAALLLGMVSGNAATEAAEIYRGALIFYVIAGVALIVGLAVTLAGVPDPPLAQLPPAERPSDPGAGHRLRRWVVDIWVEPWRHGNFAWVFLTRCFVIMGLTLFMTFIEFYFATVSHASDYIQQTAVVAVLALLGAVASALVLGMLSDHMSRVLVVCVSTLFMALAAAVFVVAPDALPLWPLGILFGLGYGAYTSVDWALAVDALPALGTAGKDMGLWNIASTLPAVLAPLVGALVIALADGFGATALGYRLVFALAGIFMLAGALFVLKVRESALGGHHDISGTQA